MRQRYLVFFIGLLLLALFSIQPNMVTVAQDGWTCAGASNEAGDCWLSSEHDALMALYNSTNGLGFSHIGWGSSSSICLWSRVVCTITNGPNLVKKYKLVTGLSLGGNGIVGTIPSAIGNLSNLTSLDINTNQFSGSLPQEIGNLTNLTRLILGANQLSGSIPAEIGNLSKLQDLELWENQLTGSIPPTIGNLTNLTNLDLSSNQLSGSIPQEIGNLTNLSGLYLGVNRLTGSIPSTVGKLIKLRTLELLSNQLSGEVPHEITNLGSTGFIYIDINFNCLRASDPDVKNFLDAHLGSSWTMYQGTDCEIPTAPDGISIQLQQPSYPTGKWVALADSKTPVDGNPILITVKAHNNGSSAVTRKVRITETVSGNVLTQQNNLLLPAGKDTPYIFIWDTTGYAWGAGAQPQSERTIQVDLIDGSGQVTASSQQSLTVIPKPLVLVHGWNSKPGTWDSYRSFMSFDPYWQPYEVNGMKTGGLNAYISSNSIEDNALVLSKEIEAQQQYYNAWHVDVVAHSLGGLITRYYIAKDMPTYSINGKAFFPISHFLMMATPNAGACDANILTTAYMTTSIIIPNGQSLVLHNQSLWAMTTGRVQRFNQVVNDLKGIPSYILYGDAGVMGQIGGFCDEDKFEHGDAIVTVASATALGIPWASNGLYHWQFTSSQGAFTTFVLPLLAIPPASSGSSTSIQSAAVSPSTETLSTPTENPVYDMVHTSGGILLQASAQSTGQANIEIAGGTHADIYLIAPPDGSASRLYNPANTLVQTIPAGTPVSPSGWQVMSVDQPQPGTWHLQMDNPGTTAVNLPVLVMIQNDPLVLDFTVAAAATNHYQVNATLTNTGSPVTGAQLATNFVGDGVIAANFSLYDDGLHQDGSANDGVYSGQSPVVAPGFYTVIVQSTKGALVRATSQDHAALPTPVLVAPADGLVTTNRQPTFTWSAVPTAVSYELRLDPADPPSVVVYSGSKTSYQPTTPLAFTTYHWQVRAVNAAGDKSAWSAPRTVRVSEPQDAAPSQNYYTALPIILTWNRVTWAQGYEVQIDKVRNFPAPTGGTVPASQLSYTITHLDEGIYYWRVHAKKSDGTWGGWSEIESFTLNLP